MSDTDLDQTFLAYSSNKRRQILYTLSFRPATINQLACEADLSLQAMHKHVRLLKKANLVQQRKAGRTNFLALNKQSMAASQQWLLQFNTVWGNDNETLENYIASLKLGH